MAKRVRASFRFWQTELFIVVIVVAILILSGSLSVGLKNTLTEMGKTNELRNASSLAQRLEPDFPVTVESLDRIRASVAEYRSIYDAGIWVYDKGGLLLDSSYDTSPSPEALDVARIAGLADVAPYATMDLKPGGMVVASRVIRGPADAREGVVVTASSVDSSLAILGAVRSRLWITFWISLVIAGLLGFTFSELISRRVRAMSKAAVAIAAGDFEQRLPTGVAPDEIYDLAVSYNQMAAKLGEAFSALKEREREIAAVVESMAEGVVAFNAEGTVRVINPEAVALLGLPDRPLGEPATALTDDPAVLEIVDASLGGAGAAATVCLGELTVLLHGAPLLDADGSVDGAVLLLSDVTERQRVEDAQRRFVADASHEMRTPIAALKGILELLSDGAKDDPEVRDDFIQTMHAEVDRLGRLVADLLTLAQLEAGSLEPAMSPVPVASLFGDVCGVMGNLAERAGVKLSLEAQGDLEVLADRDRIVQVLLGFVDNALKHSPSGSVVHLRAELVGGAVRLAVADEGTGISADEISQVFDRFYRADKARAGGRGAGLGLAIAKEIVEFHGSTITVESAPGTGTTFGFDLPLA
ncbi:MAG: cell wall metabolism sensor histidine kinase WalK [Coriobacteriia bacterium]|nr:cell wall metabolism sensor histidine kinase WalK [Coriobacteriia bacterium]